MKNSTSEPPGRPQRSNVLSLNRQTAIKLKRPARNQLPINYAYRSIDDMVHDLRPSEPVQCLRPATITSTAKWFLRQFPGDVLFAVKTNPDPRVLYYLARAGVRHFDVASLAEIKLVADTLPGSSMYFMHPVKSREAIRAAYFDYHIRDFSLDTHEELEKILEVTGHPDDLNLYVRLAMSSDKAAMSLAGKFGVPLEQASSLLVAARQASNRLGVCFHVGSQCMNPDAYQLAIEMVVDLLVQTDVRLDILDIGGGFPSIYPGMTPPALSDYMKTIKKVLKAEPKLAGCQILCEPGRALVAEGGSVVVRVELRKGNALYLNDGTYGALFDAGVPGFLYPVKAIRPAGMLADNTEAFSFYGPTCDSMDVMKGPFHLPADIREGDWIEIGQLGAYGATMRTKFNGFYSDFTVEVGDKPLLSIFGVN
ncbi:MAG: type III PLP-dependent enzyme [Rickettsiales bacterium]|nr:type III PLP-dependent enzyme [Rickettsiales bacterium]